MNEEKKKLLIVFGIYYIVTFIIVLTVILSDPYRSVLSILCSIILPLIAFIASIIIFSPAIITLYFLFKKFKKTGTRSLLVAFLIPFLNMIYYFIEHLINGASSDLNAFYSMTIGSYALVILPFIFIITIFIPKTLFKYKAQVLKTTFLMFIFGWGLVFASFRLLGIVDETYDKIILRKYEPVISKIEDFKAQNGLYPENIENIASKFKNYNYETKNNQKAYILTIPFSHTSYVEYHYCSNEDLTGCKEGWYEHLRHVRIGKWIKVLEDD